MLRGGPCNVNMLPATACSRAVVACSSTTVWRGVHLDGTCSSGGNYRVVLAAGDELGRECGGQGTEPRVLCRAGAVDCTAGAVQFCRVDTPEFLGTVGCR